MLRAEFDSRYRLADRIADGAVDSYRARDLGSGREVLVHLLSSVEHRDYLRGRLQALGAADRASVLMETTVDDVPVVVTSELPAFTSFPEWLGSRPASPSSSAAASPGEFTRLFAAPDFGVTQPASPQPAPPPVEGEFTRLFKGSAEPAAPPPAPPPPAAPHSAAPRPVIRLAVPPSRTPVQMPPGLESPKASSTGERAPVFSKGAAGPPGAVPSWPSLQAAAPEPRSAAPVRGPGEIAELIARSAGAAAEATAVSRPAPEEPAPPAAGGSSRIVLIVTLLVLVLAAAGLILHFALKRG
jgi:hypothetical protein